jgi:hypothetical protein
MSEDTLNQSLPESTPESAPEVNPIEQQARDMGWVPKDEYTGDPTRWKSAEVFVALDEPIKRIESQSQELKQVKRVLDSLKEHYSKVKETEYNRALKELKSARKQALIDGDVDKFEQLEDDIEQVKEEFTSIKQTPIEAPSPQEVVHPEFQTWLNKNPWYSSYSHMKQFADDIGVKFARQGMDRQEVLKKVEEAVRKEFPQRFTNPNKEKAPDVESGGSKQSGKARADSIELNEQERNIMNTLVRSGTVTKEQYIAELKKVKGL